MTTNNITKEEFVKFGDEELWTSTEICTIFDKHVVTIIEWKKSKGLPFITLRNDSKHKAVFYVKKEVIAWATEKGIPMFLKNSR